MGAVDRPRQVEAEGMPAEGLGNDVPTNETQDAIAQEQQRLAQGEGTVRGPCRDVRRRAASGDQVDDAHEQQDLNEGQVDIKEVAGHGPPSPGGPIEGQGVPARKRDPAVGGHPQRGGHPETAPP
jgi:hypothetical protein